MVAMQETCRVGKSEQVGEYWWKRRTRKLALTVIFQRRTIDDSCEAVMLLSAGRRKAVPRAGGIAGSQAHSQPFLVLLLQLSPHYY